MRGCCGLLSPEYTRGVRCFDSGRRSGLHRNLGQSVTDLVSRPVLWAASECLMGIGCVDDAPVTAMLTVWSTHWSGHFFVFDNSHTAAHRRRLLH